MTRDWRADGRAAITDQLRVALHLIRWVVLGAASGAIAGVGSYVLLESLERATETRLDHPWLLYLLPIAAGVTGVVYHRWGGRSHLGNSLLLEEIHEPTAWVPGRMAPMVLVGTIVSHVFGASVGREGTALQMSGSLTDLLSRAIGLKPADRRLLLIAAIAGGFGSVFGVPLAGAVFALEVQAIGRVRYEALVPALTASIVGDQVVRGLGFRHPALPQFDLDLDVALMGKVALAGVAFGLASSTFTLLAHAIRDATAATLRWPPFRQVLGGAATLGLALLVGREYLGLSLPLVERALAGHDPGTSAFALKLLFTAIALGCGIPGGEVTPLFVIGATLGAALAVPLGVAVPLLAAVGFVAVLAGAANTPLACTIMGVELFGSGAVVPMAIGCVVAYVCSTHHGIYSSQRIDIHKTGR